MSRPFRYTFILVLVALGTCLAAVSGWRYARASAPVNGPILLISVDALRADHLGTYGYQAAQTPAIDALAADGVVFERAYSHVPQTLPAHAAILTGRLPFDTGVRDSVGVTVGSNERLLAEMLRDRGYATGGVVSSFLLGRESGIDQGFAFFDATMPQAVGSVPAVRRDGAESVATAEHWLESAGTTRAFLFLHLADVHAPYIAREQFARLSPYDGGVAYADALVGRLMRFLKTHQLYDQSTVILVADHGEGLGDHGEQGHGLFVYDEVLRVPLIIKLPAGGHAGRRVKSVVQHVDLAPTILDLAKAPIPGNLRGRSLTSLMDKGTTGENVPVYSESQFARYHFGWSELASVTDGRFRYIRAPRDELYDLQRDPGERQNIADAQPETVAAMRQVLSRLTSGAPAAPGPAPITDQDRDRFEALGYVGARMGLADPEANPADPKDKFDILERYREAVDLASLRNLEGAIERWRSLSHQEPDMPDVWMRLGAVAHRAGHQDVAVDAYRRASHLAPDNPDAHLGASSALLRMRKFDEARQQAQRVLEGSADHAGASAAAHELLALIALERRNADLARVEAGLAEKLDATRPVRAYVEGRLAFERRRYVEALESFEPALALIAKTHGRPLADLRLYAAEALVHAARVPEAEGLFAEELGDFPRSARARGGLGAIYSAAGRRDEAALLAQH